MVGICLKAILDICDGFPMPSARSIDASMVLWTSELNYDEAKEKQCHRVPTSDVLRKATTPRKIPPGHAYCSRQPPATQT
eukprot:2314995-Lingulodinium_polyedra.AAC.1